MNQRQAHIVEGAAKPGGHYSHAIVANGFAYVSGQGPVDPATGIKSEEFGEQVRQTLRNLETILKGIGLSLADVVKINSYVTDLTKFREYDQIYREFFKESPPARTTIGCELNGILVEIDCVAAVPQP